MESWLYVDRNLWNTILVPGFFIYGWRLKKLKPPTRTGWYCLESPMVSPSLPAKISHSIINQLYFEGVIIAILWLKRKNLDYESDGSLLADHCFPTISLLRFYIKKTVELGGSFYFEKINIILYLYNPFFPNSKHMSHPSRNHGGCFSYWMRLKNHFFHDTNESDNKW